MDEALLRAYRATRYVVPLPGREIVVRIGRRSPAMDALLAGLGVRSAAFVTAWNPRSRPLPEAENRRAAERLAAEASDRGLRFLPQEGRGDAGDWPPEPGLLLLDLDPGEAVALAERYGQNALVWCEPERPARLVLTRWAQEEADGPPD